jgi:hypothetical protein
VTPAASDALIPKKAKKISGFRGGVGRTMIVPTDASLSFVSASSAEGTWAWVESVRPAGRMDCPCMSRLARAPGGRGPAGHLVALRGRGVFVGAEVEVVEVGVGAVRGEVDAGVDATVEDEGVLG